MAFKFVIVFALFAAASTSPVQQLEYSEDKFSGQQALSSGYKTKGPLLQAYAPKLVTVPTYNQLEYQAAAPAPVSYDFNYAVHDEHTGDIKSQQEIRNGDSVQGRYELIDSDGFKRIVEYTADDHNGFNAVVHREPVDIKIPQPIRHEHNLAYSAPAAKVVPSYAHQVAKAEAQYSAPAYATQSYSGPAYSAQAHASPVYSTHAAPVYSTQSSPVYKTKVYSAPAYNAHAYSTPDYNIQAYSAPVYNTENYAVPAYKSQVYSAPSYKSQAYSAPAHNTQVYSLPAYNSQAYSAPAYNSQDHSATDYNNQIYTAPAYNSLAYSAPVYNPQVYSAPQARIAYAAPVAKAANSPSTPITVYSAPAKKEYFSEESYTASTAQPTAETAQAKVIVSSAPAFVTQEPKVEILTNKNVPAPNGSLGGSQKLADYSSAGGNSYATYSGSSANYNY